MLSGPVDKSMQAKRRPTRRFLAAVSLLSLSLCLGWAYEHRPAPSPKLLFQTHNRVRDVEWTSNHTLLIIREEDGLKGQGAYSLSQIDIDTQQETPLTALTQRLNRPISPESVQISPDRKRLLWAGHLSTYPRSKGFFIQEVSLDAAEYSIFPLGVRMANEWPYANQFCWQPDSAHWMEFRSVSDRDDRLAHITLHTFGSAASSFLPDPPRNAGFNTFGRFQQQDEYLVSLDLAGLPTVITTTEISLTAPTKLVRRYSLSGYSDMFVGGMCLSPNANSVAAITSHPLEETWWSKLCRLLPFLPDYSHRVDRLIVANINGSDRHEVPTPILDKKSDPSLHVTDLHWSPDGKALSFYYAGGYYVVPSR
ncbi:MAG: hypothetical protein JWN14_4409 [Chthonomonadales bacterium]|nr:hypothetical protein [Chthonomonadales bacterium]